MTHAHVKACDHVLSLTKLSYANCNVMRYVKAKHWELARDAYESAIELNPKCEKSHSNLSMVYNRLGEKSLALSHAEECISLKPLWFRGYQRIAETCEPFNPQSPKFDPRKPVMYNLVHHLNPKFPLPRSVPKYIVRTSLDDMRNPEMSTFIQSRDQNDSFLRWMHLLFRRKAYIRYG